MMNEFLRWLGLALEQYSRALGYGQLSGIELPGEVAGLVPDPNWKRINQSEKLVNRRYLYWLPLARAMCWPTPMQVLESMATIADDGSICNLPLSKKLMMPMEIRVKTFEPKLLWDITKDPVISVLDDNGNPTGATKVVDPWVVKELQTGLREVVVSGQQ